MPSGCLRPSLSLKSSPISKGCPNLGLGKDFLNITPKPQSTERLTNWTSSKLEYLALQKTLLIKWENKY